MARILIIDDEPAIGWSLGQALTGEGHEVQVVATAEEGLELARQSKFELALTDVRLPRMDGLILLRELQAVAPTTPVIVMTAFGNLEIAVQAVQTGAFEYLTKPFDLDAVLAVVARALESQSQPADIGVAGLSQPDSLLIGKSPQMQAVFRKIALVASQSVPVLITGESGTGKELVAQALHRFSSRSKAAFVPVCVPALNESLVESELFGHRSGAFTGAHRDRRGLLEQAHEGTAFFDEVGDVPLPVQVKLLRVLESRSVTPVGGNSPVETDFRLIAATNRSLQSMVQAGTFREDLYYRLNVFRIELPPLRERGDDILLLAEHFLRNVQGRTLSGLAESTRAELMHRPWRGNVRELRNAIEHAAILSRGGQLLPEFLPDPISNDGQEDFAPNLAGAVKAWLNALDLQNANQGVMSAFLDAVEPTLLQHALNQSRGNRQEAARLLGIHRQTLREKLRKHQIADE